MLLPTTKYAHFTVPHSGTRYINRAVEDATGYKAWQCSSVKGIERLRDGKNAHLRNYGDDFIFCHVGQRWDDFIDLVLSHEHIKTWVTVREPISTWGTHFANISDTNNMRSFYEVLGQLRGQYETLSVLKDKVGYIHRIEDPISGLGEYLELPLKEHTTTFSRGMSPVKAAIQNRDLDALEELSSGHDFWRAFRDFITPDYRELWESLGYEVWWG